MSDTTSNKNIAMYDFYPLFNCKYSYKCKYCKFVLISTRSQEEGMCNKCKYPDKQLKSSNYRDMNKTKSVYWDSGLY